MYHNIKEKECYWIPHPTKVYTLVMIKEIEGKQCIANQIDENIDIELDVPDCPFYPVNPSSVEDMTSLHYLHEAGILSNLEERSKFHHKTPYTYVANVLIAVNPLQTIPDKVFEHYRGRPISSCEPHPYGIAEVAFRQLTLPRIKDRNQSIIISGESGSGKTETAKIILKYLCWRSSNGIPSQPSSSITSRDRSGSNSVSNAPMTRERSSSATPTIAVSMKKAEYSLESKLMQSNPVFEAFGNAKTQRNNNSSRFGKFLKLQFDERQEFKLVSASIDTYLLETSRVVSVTPGERNYHIFYQMLNGTSSLLRKKWHLKDVRSYRYLTESTELEIEGVNDSAKFIEVLQALTQLGVTPQEQDCLFRCLNGILLLGNIEFDSNVDNEENQEIAFIDETYLIDRTAEQFGVDRNLLEQTLLTKFLDMSATTTNINFGSNESSGGDERERSGSTAVAKHDSIRIPRTVAQAIYARDSMAKAIYQRIFDWIVKLISASLNYQEGNDYPYIGVLDIFGFEDFLINGLEQLLINYANESLQSIYNTAILKAEKELFVSEGLTDVNDINEANEVQSNYGCVELIGIGSRSIVSYLDSCCVRPGTEDEVFVSLLHSNIKKNPFFPPTNNIDKKFKFKVKHYARNVTYTVGNFITRNTDMKLTELNEMLQSSTHNSKCTLFDMSNVLSKGLNGQDIYEMETSEPPPPWIDNNSPNPRRRSSMSKIDIVNSPVDDVNSVKIRATRSGSDAMPLMTNTKKYPPHKSIAATFIRRMGNLSKVLESTKCSFIRCIKPNDAMLPGTFDKSYVVDQLRCLGVVQTCEVLKVGLPTRIPLQDLENMYRPLLPPKMQQILRRLSEHGFVNAVMWAFQIPTDSYKIGRTKVFFRIGKISLLNEITEVDMNSERGEWLARRLSRYVQRMWWRKIAIRILAEKAWVSSFLKIRAKRCAIIFLQRTWMRYYRSNNIKRHRYLRRRWRIAILKVRISQAFLHEYTLIKEARSIRIANEELAAKHIEELELAENEREQEIAYEIALKEEADMLADLQTTNSTGVKVVPQRSTSIAISDDDAKARNEMKALVAASNLATVSVSLFRWTKIKLFAAFETWLQVLPFAPVGKFKRLSAIRHPQSTGDKSSTPSQEVDEPSISATQSTEDTVIENKKIDFIEVKLVDKNPVIAAKIVENMSSGVATSSPTSQRSGSALRVDDESMGELCYECFTRVSILWCSGCIQAYCKLCSQFVHNSCRHMKTHTIVVLNEKSQTNPHSSITTLEEEEESGDVITDLPSKSAASKLFNKADKEVLRRRSAAPVSTKLGSQCVLTSLDVSVDARRPSIKRRPSTMAPSFHTMGITKSASSSGATSAPGHEPCAIKSCDKPACKGVSIRFCEEHYEEFRASMKSNKENSDEHDTLQKQVALLKKQLQESGQQPVEFVELSVAREKMQEAVQRLMGGDESAEKDIEKYDKSIRMNPEYQKEMEEKAKQWEIDQAPINRQCLMKMRSIIPPNVASTSVTQMIADGLPKSIATRLWTKKVLWLICTHPDDIKKIHIADLQTKYGNQGLDIIEMRAIWINLPLEFDNDGDGKKLEWRKLFRQKLEELSAKEANNRLSAMEKRNPAYKGHDALVVYDCNVEIQRTEIQKSTAFDATEKPAIVGSALGDTLKDIKKQKGVSEKPLHEGMLAYITGGSANAEGPVIKAHCVLLMNKKLIQVYNSQAAFKEGEEPPIKEVTILKTFSVKVGPGNKAFSILDNGTDEIILFESDKVSREKWVTHLNEVIVYAAKAPLVSAASKQSKIAEEEVVVETEAPPPRPSGMLAGIMKRKPKGEDDESGDKDDASTPPPKPSFLAAIASKKNAKNADSPADGGDAPAEKPSFLSAIANRKKAPVEGNDSAGTGADAKPSFLSAIANRKKSSVDENAGAGEEVKPSFLSAIANRKQASAESTEGQGTSSATDSNSAPELTPPAKKAPRSEMI